MVYMTEVPKLGLTLEIKPYRKSCGGRSGRVGKTGKKATVKKANGDVVEIYGDSFKALCKKLRSEFRIPTNITINEGRTEL